MSDLAKAAEHQAFRVERVGDLLIVTPVGSPIEFSTNLFQSEFDRVKKLAARSEFRNVLVDMSNSSYFGSEMIGALLDLRRAVAAGKGHTLTDDSREGGSVIEGGVMALSGLSDDMAAGLKIMNVDTLMLTFDTRSQAIRTLARQSFGDRVRQLGGYWRALIFLIPVLVLTLLFFAGPSLRSLTRPSAKSDFQSVCSIYERWQLKQRNALSAEESQRAVGPMLKELDEVQQHSKDAAATDAHRQVGSAAESLAKWMTTPSSGTAKQNFVGLIYGARSELSEEIDQKVSLPDDFPKAPPKETATASKKPEKAVPEAKQEEPAGGAETVNDATPIPNSATPSADAETNKVDAKTPKTESTPVESTSEDDTTSSET